MNLSKPIKHLIKNMALRPFDFPIPDYPLPPYPISTELCDIICGFGRGSAELGIPTANVPIEQLPAEINDLDLGVYFGFAKINKVDKSVLMVDRNDGRQVQYNFGKFLSAKNGDLDTLPVVLSIGKNPFYDNKFKTVELHVLHKFSHDFYGAKLKFNILGYIRPELDYTTKEALINDINIDIEITKKVLSYEGYAKYKDILNA
ncbi:hypothetical protein KAFR_0E02750 [Kazachstania africana CBS 2517]|uniref:Riboflavin kinase n=1 Tax=Kazachstania africana (strain ATCC 22294 / BCRC 22015 / CBS 2517 / CECT 1963 / NBRC 1671 / NRRL Y-8276) TaxID=1071382 RepID=H2AVM7_KAZAF|nr:hypothetical protein KAFR_0E02750 [Kazachstania africana CBS 2517]CCF58427.1 hypothetical protein KAFR_0E02750 [Kazachstania africana CBS 2517]